jgi:hypothetical protein
MQSPTPEIPRKPKDPIQDCVKNTGKMGMWGVHTLFTSIMPSISDLA